MDQLKYQEDRGDFKVIRRRLIEGADYSGVSALMRRNGWVMLLWCAEQTGVTLEYIDNDIPNMVMITFDEVEDSMGLELAGKVRAFARLYNQKKPDKDLTVEADGDTVTITDMY